MIREAISEAPTATMKMGDEAGDVEVTGRSGTTTTGRGGGSVTTPSSGSGKQFDNWQEAVMHVLEKVEAIEADIKKIKRKIVKDRKSTS